MNRAARGIILKKYLNASINCFLNDLKEKKPVPGGGSAAALTGALAAGLLSMVCGFSCKNKKDISDRSLKDIQKKSVYCLDKLKKLMQDDMESYNVYSWAVKSKKKNKMAVKKALLKTLKPPLDTLRLMPDLMECAFKLTALSKGSIISDVAAAASLIWACFETASFNVKVNLKAINDEKLSIKVKEEIRDLSKKLSVQKKDILNKVNKQII